MAVIKVFFTVGIHRSALFKIIVSQFFRLLHPILNKVNIRSELNFQPLFFLDSFFLHVSAVNSNIFNSTPEILDDLETDELTFFHFFSLVFVHALWMVDGP